VQPFCANAFTGSSGATGATAGVGAHVVGSTAGLVSATSRWPRRQPLMQGPTVLWMSREVNDVDRLSLWIGATVVDGQGEVYTGQPRSLLGERGQVRQGVLFALMLPLWIATYLTGGKASTPV
jgi:hypothetical protein